MHEPAKGHLKKQNITYAKGLRKVADGFRRGLWPPVRLRCSHPNLGAFIAKLLSYAEDLGLGFGGDSATIVQGPVGSAERLCHVTNGPSSVLLHSLRSMYRAQEPIQKPQTVCRMIL
jgi:hypothetical protein